MAIITSTVDDLSLLSSYTCSTTRLIGVSSDGSQVDQISNSSTSSPTRNAQTITFNYDTVDLSSVNMVVLQAKGGSTPYGGFIHVNGNSVYASQGLFTAYLDVSSIGPSSASFTIDFQTYTQHHTHYNDADTQQTVSGGTNHAKILYTKKHDIYLALSEITLKIYDGNDVVAVPSAAQLCIGVGGIAKKVTDMFVGIGGKAKRVSEAWIGINGLAKKIFPTLVLSILSPGDIVQMDEMGDGNFVDWVVMHHNYYGEGQTVLMRKHCLPDSSQINTNGGSGKYTGAYFDKVMDKYLTNNWLLSTGYLTFQSLLLDTTIAVRRWSDGRTDTGVRKVWLPSAANFSTEYANTDDENGVFDYFTINSDKSYRIAYKETNLSEAVYYWTRSAVGGTHPLWRSIDPNGSVYGANYWDDRAIRPVINVYSNNYLEKVSEGVYRMIGGGAA